MFVPFVLAMDWHPGIYRWCWAAGQHKILSGGRRWGGKCLLSIEFPKLDFVHFLLRSSNALVSRSNVIACSLAVSPTIPSA
jgi:hypothetical protein